MKIYGKKFLNFWTYLFVDDYRVWDKQNINDFLTSQPTFSAKHKVFNK
jgi:hypothetical protein